MNIEDFLIEKDINILEAMNILDSLGRKALFLTENKKLIASITDGDIRRWILKKGDLEASVKKIANFNPKYLFQNNKTIASEFMKQNSIEVLPILNDSHEIISVILWTEEEIKINRSFLDVPVVIMAGGLGTRLYPYTKILPKPLIPIGEIPIIEHIMNKFNEFGCKKFYLIVNHKKNMIKAYINEIVKDYDVEFIEEDEYLGTGGGLSLLKEKIDKTFFLTNCDILIQEDFKEIFDYHKDKKNMITVVSSLKNLKIPYGVIEFDEEGNIISTKEKPQINFFVNTGMYVVEKDIIDNLNINTKIDFPEIINQYKDKKAKVGIFPVSENRWMDMGQLDEMEKMRNRIEKNE